MRYVRGGIALDYSDEGQGVPLVLIHGFANDRTLWQPQVDALRARYRVIAPSLRGFGESSDTDGSPVSMDAYAQDVVGLLEHLGIDAAVVGGISLGGYVALAMAVSHPRRVRALVLANTRAGADPPEWKAFREDMVSSVQARGAEAVVENYADKPFARDCPADIKERVRAMIRRQRTPGLVSGTRGMAARPDRTAALASIRVPTLVIHGTDDQYIPSSEAQLMHRAIEGSRYVNLERAGHLSNVDSAARFNAVLEAFLEDITRPATP
jgi:3-oxoadipate enol-lactonase